MGQIADREGGKGQTCIGMHDGEDGQQMDGCGRDGAELECPELFGGEASALMAAQQHPEGDAQCQGEADQKGIAAGRMEQADEIDGNPGEGEVHAEIAKTPQQPSFHIDTAHVCLVLRQREAQQQIGHADGGEEEQFAEGLTQALLAENMEEQRDDEDEAESVFFAQDGQEEGGCHPDAAMGAVTCGDVESQQSPQQGVCLVHRVDVQHRAEHGGREIENEEGDVGGQSVQVYSSCQAHEEERVEQMGREDEDVVQGREECEVAPGDVAQQSVERSPVVLVGQEEGEVEVPHLRFGQIGPVVEGGQQGDDKEEDEGLQQEYPEEGVGPERCQRGSVRLRVGLHVVFHDFDGVSFFRRKRLVFSDNNFQ